MSNNINNISEQDIQKIITLDGLETFYNELKNNHLNHLDDIDTAISNHTSDIQSLQNDNVIVKGDADNSAVLKGSNNIASGTFSVAIGADNVFGNINGVPEGDKLEYAKATGYASHAEGAAHALGDYSHAEGGGNTDLSSLGFKVVSTAEGECSHAEGTHTHAKGGSSHAEGFNTKTGGTTNENKREAGDLADSGAYAHAEGNATIAKGVSAHSEGRKTIAIGNASHAEGQDTVAEGYRSHAEGKNTRAIGRSSHTEGEYTIANNTAEHASGQYNISTKSSDKSQATQFSIGIGTSDTDRKNAFEVKQNGDIYIDGVEGRIQDKLNNILNVDIDLLVPIEHNDLKKLRDQNQLISGQKYRITDYITITTQENTSSAGHLFDVIVTALDDHTLSENASAIRSDRDLDGYFGTENVEAWQLKYCLDNDTERFAWADNSAVQWYSRIVANYIVDQSGTHAYALDKESYIYDYGNEPHPDTGEDTLVFYTGDPMYFKESGADHQDIYFYNGITTVDGVEYDSWRKYSDAQWVNAGAPDEGVYALTERVVYNGEFVWPDNTGIENGKGVIYNMIDEYGNECPYDFKNIKFCHDGLGTDVYTFTWIDDYYEVVDTSVFGNNGRLTLYGEITGVYGNVIKPYIKMIYDEDSGDYIGTKQLLNNITFISDFLCEENGNEGFYGCFNNSFGNNCHNNSFGNNCHNNSFGNNCHNNSFGNGCNNNSFKNSCSCNSLGNNCHNNSFGNGCSNNSFRLSASTSASLLNHCSCNHFDDDCSYNVIWNIYQEEYLIQMKNIHVIRGVVGRYSSYNFINVENDANYEIKVAKNSRGEIKVYCEADLIA